MPHLFLFFSLGGRKGKSKREGRIKREREHASFTDVIHLYKKHSCISFSRISIENWTFLGLSRWQNLFRNGCSIEMPRMHSGTSEHIHWWTCRFMYHALQVPKERVLQRTFQWKLILLRILNPCASLWTFLSFSV